jgi:2OG-Fe(II) oxygenase superfamily/Elongation factor G, domain IV
MYVYKTVGNFAAMMTQYVTMALCEGPFGWRVTDCTVTMTECGYISPSTTAAHFRKLTPLVLMAALDQAGTVVCEPMIQVSLEIPAETTGSVLAAVARLGGSAGAPVLHADLAVVRTLLPAARAVLFRVFRYPAPLPGEDGWGAGEHTDYGLLTLLAQDANGGLQVRTPGGWIDAPPIEGTFVANIGDMLDRLTGGWYRSTPHRVRNVSGRDRFSFPFFFDPDFTAEIPPLPGRAAIADGGQPRWDGQNLQAHRGTYGDYLLGKVSKVFPQLRREVLTDEAP